MHLKDSGVRREFDSGAVRDIQEGKGRCDLLPLDAIYDVYRDDIIFLLSKYQHTGSLTYIASALATFSVIHYRGTETALLEVAKHYEDGCQKYGENNWRRGIPIHCYFDSGIRHYLKFKRGDDDEPHDRAFVWNMLGLLWTSKNKPELIDIPVKEE